MFDATLIPKEPSEGLQAGYTIRPMQSEDYERGVLDVLAVLTTVGAISKQSFDDQLAYWESAGVASYNGRDRIFFPVVIADGQSNVVGCGMLVVERKLIHELGVVGHIEDISVKADQQGMKLGKRLIQALSGIAKNVGCYKVILDCSEQNVGFYEKCGYKRAGVEMDLRF